MEYFYILKNIHTGKMYAGSRYSKTKVLDPAQLLNKDHPHPYFTSSKTIKEDVDSYVIVKIKVFPNGGAWEYETRFLKKINARKNPLWINRHNNDGVIKESFTGKRHSEETKNRIGNAHRGRVRSEEAKSKQSYAMKGRAPWNNGVPHSDEAKLKMKESASKRTAPAWNKGVRLSEEQSNNVCRFHYDIRTPSGDVIRVMNLNKFIKDHDLKRSTLERMRPLKGYLILAKFQAGSY